MGQQQGVNISNLLGQIGQAQAGGALAQGSANTGLINAFSNFGGQMAGIDWSQFASPPPETTTYGNAYTPTPLATNIPTSTPF